MRQHHFLKSKQNHNKHTLDTPNHEHNYIDIDSLRPDHLGCYGYHRNTSPNIDKIAAEGIRLQLLHTRCVLLTKPYSHDNCRRVFIRVLWIMEVNVHMFNYGETERLETIGRIQTGESMKENGTIQLGSICWTSWCVALCRIHGATHTGFGGQETADLIAPINDGFAKIQWRKPFFMVKCLIHIRPPHSFRSWKTFWKRTTSDWAKSIRMNTGKFHQRVKSMASNQDQTGCINEYNLNLFQACPKDNRPRSRIWRMLKMFDGYDTGVMYADRYVEKL